MKRIILLAAILISIAAFSQSKPARPAGGDEITIRKILDDQAMAWNRGDIEGFMQGYWKNDSLLFIGKSGITTGWQRTLNNYKKSYPDTTAMGKLAFDIVLVKNQKLKCLKITDFIIIRCNNKT